MTLGRRLVFEESLTLGALNFFVVWLNDTFWSVLFCSFTVVVVVVVDDDDDDGNNVVSNNPLLSYLLSSCEINVGIEGDAINVWVWVLK